MGPSLLWTDVFIYFWTCYSLVFGRMSLVLQDIKWVGRLRHDAHCYACHLKWLRVLRPVTSRYRGKAPVTWQTTWRSRWTTLTPSPCRSRASHQQNAGRTCTSCSISTPSSLIPLGFWRKAPQRTACQVGVSSQLLNPTCQLQDAFFSVSIFASSVVVLQIPEYLTNNIALYFHLYSYLLDFNFLDFNFQIHNVLCRICHFYLLVKQLRLWYNNNILKKEVHMLCWCSDIICSLHKS